MLSCLALDGRVGLTAIDLTPDHAQHLYDETARTIANLARTRTTQPV
jgi:hypothetical protein